MPSEVTCKGNALSLNVIFNQDSLAGLGKISSGSVDAVITDPPYGIAKKKPMAGSSHGKIRTLSSEWDIFASDEEFTTFTESWIRECHRILKPTGCIAVWGDRRNIFLVQRLLEEIFPKFLDLLTWTKRDAPPNLSHRGLAASTEFCLIYCKSETGWTFNEKDLKKYNGGKQARNYLNIQRTMPASERTGHPTQKKLETQSFLVEMLTNPGDLIVDPFVGSGTTAYAARLLNRNYLCFECDPDYWHLASDRLESLSRAA